MELGTFAKKFIVSHPFVSFNDIYDVSNGQNPSLQKTLCEIYERSQRSGYKTLLLYGPRGSGKTLAVHALAYHIGGIVAQIEGLEFFKIQFFIKEFARICSENTSKERPLVIFVKNINTLVSNALNELLFLFDKFSNDKRNLILVASSSIPMNYLPKQFKFTYIQCINCANQRNKYNLFKFLTNKFGIVVNMPEQDLINFVYQNYRNYSNNDIFLVIRVALDIKKKNGGSLEEIDRNTLEQSTRSVRGTLSPQIIQAYNL
jgi:SpoVK/Ycf46/Vps4 family AAA+-type ATPase